ncbi:retrovirus-related pol polyprotein from transposon TNT 1-94 [Tanacetum coccineum]
MEENRNIDREIALEKKIKQLDNIIFKRDQSAQTVHMMTKSKICYDHFTKHAIGFEKPFYLKKVQESKPKLYDGNVILKMDAIVIPNSDETLMLYEVVQIVLWYLDSGCSKHMTGDRSQLTNFISKFLGTVKFGNDQVAKIMGYGDYQIGNVTISRVYYIEGLGHNLFSVGQFCDSNLEVAFRQHTCFIRNLEGVDLLTGSRGDNLYTLSLGNMMASSPICLLSKASKTKSWLWHRRLSHLNFGAINHLARHGLVRGLPKLKFEKDHLCSACALGKSSKKPHKPKSEDTNQEKLYLLHMDLCGPMRVASVNGKKYILVIVDDYSRFTWVKCLRSKDEAPALIINFLKMIQVRLKETVRRIRTDNGTEFVNQTLREYYEKVGISHETSVARSPQQNGVVERRNRTLIEAARTMLIYAKAPLFLWAEAVATACYTQNRSMIRRRHGKTPYELLHDKPPDLSYLHVFGALCYPTNDCENLGKLQPKAFIGYAPTKKAFRIYNRLFFLTGHLHGYDHPVTISSGLVPNPPPSTPFVPPLRSEWDLLFQPMFDESLNPPPYVDLQAPEVIAPIPEVVAPEHAVLTGSPSSTIVDQDAFIPSWIYKVKLDELGGILKNKARLVARGYRQEEFRPILEGFVASSTYLTTCNKLRKLCSVDPTLFIRREGKELLLVQIYVDDIIFAASTPELCDLFAKIIRVSWSSKRRKRAALSSTEAVYIALSGCVAAHSPLDEITILRLMALDSLNSNMLCD